ncbi:flap endonuclease GEN homolog 1 [Caerostris darwini]|uniref:Flap endonuclease GEN homolog 1 n=1 Tax=Caerostris darwini TaxID=1538125 RepID=A0AAV4RZE0_9ARAC|nr:flap endonuclease GEN homolog 1 [Caerostris darwini]
MGVTCLWSILSDVCERKDLSYLSGKRVAIDLSGWVVQAIQCKALNQLKNPHLRNLFCRVSWLLLNDVHPIFVLEGKVPELKQAALKKRNCQDGGTIISENLSRSTFDRILKQCQDLLKSLGVPCIKSSGEAEAFCAFLCAKRIVDGVITNDNDAFLYGADTVFRDFTIDPKDAHVNMYSLNSTKNKLQLNQQTLIGLALLLGCDYSKGVPGIGKEAAVKLIKELQDCDLLQRFQDWKTKKESEIFPGYDTDMKKKESHCTRCSHIGSSSKHKREGCIMCDSKITCYVTDPKNPCTCMWHKNNDIKLKQKNEYKVYSIAKDISGFPDQKVIDEYLKFSDIVPDDTLIDWTCPDLKEFQIKALQYLGWNPEKNFEKWLPIVTSWQQFKLSRNCKISSLYKPIKVLKFRTVKGESCLEVQWASTGNETCCEQDEKSLCTVELEERFKKSYPQIAEDFYSSIEKSKSPSKSKTKYTIKSPSNKKMTDFFSVSKTGREKEEHKIENTAKRSVEESSDNCEPSVRRQCMSV